MRLSQKIPSLLEPILCTAESNEPCNWKRRNIWEGKKKKTTTQQKKIERNKRDPGDKISRRWRKKQQTPKIREKQKDPEKRMAKKHAHLFFIQCG